jgi:hypothetical protein
MNRCPGINKNNKWCRNRVNGKIFCCDNHKPINLDIVDNECFLCYEKINNSKELIFLRCRHAFHKECFLEWNKFSTYNTLICLICRYEVKEYDKKEKIYPSLSQKYVLTDNSEILKINNILNNFY